MTSGTLSVSTAKGNTLARVAAGMFPKVEEVMTDMILMDLVHSSASFISELCTRAGIEGAFVGARRSVFHDAHGETDVEIILETAQGNHALLVENKIDAPLMPKQFERYHRRGTVGMEEGQWGAYTIVLFSPISYMEHLPEEHRSFIDVFVSYEDVSLFLEDKPQFAFKRAVLQGATETRARGYVKNANPTVMTFYSLYYELASTRYPQLKMELPGVRGASNTWALFKNVNGYRRVDLVHKWLKIGCELSIPTGDVDGVRVAILPLLESGMTFKPSKSVAYVNIQSEPVDHFAPFESLTPALVAALGKLDRLRLFAARPEVDDVIRRFAKH